jgi:hypothetical protein
MEMRYEAPDVSIEREQKPSPWSIVRDAPLYVGLLKAVETWSSTRIRGCGSAMIYVLSLLVG